VGDAPFGRWQARAARIGGERRSLLVYAPPPKSMRDVVLSNAFMQ